MNAPTEERHHLHELLLTASKQRATGWKANLRQWLCPLDYLRTREIPILLELFSKHHGTPLRKILDVGSPQLLTCHLARSMPDAEVTYVNLFQPEVDDLRRRQAALGLPHLNAIQADVRQATLWSEGTFDAIVSCSVLEHIHDVAGCAGDQLAIQNLADWLRPGGLLAFSVPFSREGFDDYAENPVYAAEGAAANGRYFFQRFYDATSLATRLIKPSGLEVLDQVYLGEERYRPQDKHQRLAARLSGRWLPLILGPFFPWIARQVMHRAPEWQSLRKPYVAFFLLRKPIA
jgi:2-polyprenyl-3-methyl-5-hydroxy-6-metoxy-1,4-benzoquinol methylase